MAIKWLDAKRLQGTNAERLALNGGTSEEEIVLDDDPSSPYSWGTGEGQYAPTTPTPSNENNYNGVFINTNSAIKGKTLTKIKGFFCKKGSPNTSGSIRLGVMSGTGSGSSITWVTDGYVEINDDISTLNTGFPATPVAIEVELPTPHELEANDTIALGLTGGNYDSSNNIAWQYSDGTNMYDSSNTARNRFSNGSWTGSGMSSDMHCTITVQTSLPPPLQNGTIFNEIDTYKYFMFNSGAGTWHQMVSS